MNLYHTGIQNNKIKSILYVYLPLGKNIKIFPIGVIYLAHYVHAFFPEVKQQILDLSMIKPASRRTELNQQLNDIKPDIVAFSWRQLRYFGSELYDEKIRDILYCSSRNIKKQISFLYEGAKRFKNYTEAILENINYIKVTCKLLQNAHILVGGSGFSIFYENILKKLPARVIGVIGEGEKTLVALVQGADFKHDKVVMRTGDEIHKGKQDHRIFQIDDVNPFTAVDYEYIKSIFPGYCHYKGDNIPVQTNRGCSQDCIYCPDTARDRKLVSNRKPAEIIKEIQRVKKVFETKTIWFPDRLVVSSSSVANFKEFLRQAIDMNLNIRWNGYMRPDVFTSELAGLIVNSGLNKFIIPVTSGSQEVIDILKLGIDIPAVLRGCRMLREANYRGPVEVEFTLGTTNGFKKDIKESHAFYAEIKKIFEGQEVVPIFNLCSVLPGAALEKLLIKNGYLRDTYDSMTFNPFLMRKFAYIHPYFHKIMVKAYDHVNLDRSPHVIKKEEALLDFLYKFC